MSEQTPKVTGFKDFMRRAGWASLALLFVVTGLGVGLYAFWQGTHQKDTSATASTCEIQSTATAEVLKDPTVAKADHVIKKVEAKDLSVGSGDTVKSGDCIKVKYFGALASNGKKFDSNYPEGQALQFGIGQSEVISGMEIGAIGMKPGGERLIYIPSSLGYGAQGNGPVPANADLIFQVKLLGIR